MAKQLASERINQMEIADLKWKEVLQVEGVLPGLIASKC
jgi:hypothetical protein